MGFWDDVARAFQFRQKSFVSILATESIFSIRFANLINLPLVHWYSNSSDGEFGEGPSGASLRCGSFCAILDDAVAS